MAKTIARLEAEKEGIAGVVLTSAKKTFAGGDLNELIKVTKADAPAFYQGILELKGQLRRLETLGKPVVAAINGAALGGGWEICLACHHRIALTIPACARPAGGDSRPVAGRRRDRAHGATAWPGESPAVPRRRQEGASGGSAQGRADPRTGRQPRGNAGEGPRLDPRQPGGEAALGQRRLQDSRRYACQSQRGADAGHRTVGAARQDQGLLPGAREDHVRGSGGRPGRFRHRATDRGALFHRADHRPGGEEHDRHLLVPAQRDQRRQVAAAGVSGAGDEKVGVLGAG